MRLVVQIPCFNEAETLPQTLASIPRSIPGVSELVLLVVDDGSTDGTSEVALRNGVHKVLKNTANRGLAHTFRRALDGSLALGADVIVNMDGDHQYDGCDIPKLIAPILERRADMVVGDRQVETVAAFSPTKKVLQKFGSFVIRRLSRTDVRDATSGFRAFSRAAALKITVLSNYTYTLESILQARSKALKVVNVPIRSNPPTRQSRLFANVRTYLTFSAATIIRIFTMYNPLRVFLDLGLLFLILGIGLCVRFLYFYFGGSGSGHVQSLIMASILIVVGMSIILVGLVADLIQFNRRLLEDILERVRKLELRTPNDHSNEGV